MIESPRVRKLMRAKALLILALVQWRYVLAMDVFWPITDDAEGIVEMTEEPPAVPVPGRSSSSKIRKKYWNSKFKK